jgi:hypothetical protein
MRAFSVSVSSLLETFFFMTTSLTFSSVCARFARASSCSTFRSVTPSTPASLAIVPSMRNSIWSVSVKSKANVSSVATSANGESSHSSAVTASAAWTTSGMKIRSFGLPSASRLCSNRARLTTRMSSISAVPNRSRGVTRCSAGVEPSG